MSKITESSSNYNNLESKSTRELLQNINQEDAGIHLAVAKAIPQIEKLVDLAASRVKEGGRVFYIGAGTSGRLGVLDASELPPTYGVPNDIVIGLIAGGDVALRKAVESAEDNPNGAWDDLQVYNLTDKDTIIGIAASGGTPYVNGGLIKAREKGLLTSSISCNPNSPVSQNVDIPIEVVVGPEFVTGSTRMKAGTAQKLILNMFSTTLMIKLGRVQGNNMVNMQLNNDKLVDRGIRIITQTLEIDYESAKSLLLEHGSVKKAVEAYRANP